MSSLVKILFFLGDIFLLNLSVVLSSFLTGNWSNANTADKVYLLIYSNLGWLFLTLVSNPYNLNKGWSVSKVINSQFAFVFIHLLIVASLIFFFKRSYSPIQIGLMYLTFVSLFFSWRVIIYYFRKVFTPDILIKNYILVGNNSISNEIRKYYLLNPQLGYKFKGYFNI